MNILTLESSSLSASVCITEDTKLLAQSFQNCGLTHSATLLPMIDHIMTSAQMTLADIDVIACVTGPGSFTGVRIGVSTASITIGTVTLKGMALATIVAIILSLTFRCIARLRGEPFAPASKANEQATGDLHHE